MVSVKGAMLKVQASARAYLKLYSGPVRTTFFALPAFAAKEKRD